MRPKWLYTLVLLAASGCLLGQQPKSQPKPGTAASGVFLGKSGKPMAGARLILCHALEDQAKIRLLPNVPTATADAQGRFSFRGFDPGRGGPSFICRRGSMLRYRMKSIPRRWRQLTSPWCR